MTEEEAKQRWCPFARVVMTDEDGGDPSGVNANRVGVRGTSDVRTHAATLCIASACMAWRSINSRPGKVRDISMGKRHDDGWMFVPDTSAYHRHNAKAQANWGPQWEIVEESQTGYCGLAGSPA
jgi:hypothetical protein